MPFKIIVNGHIELPIYIFSAFVSEQRSFSRGRTGLLGCEFMGGLKQPKSRGIRIFLPKGFEILDMRLSSAE
jgi:hypothetical protein